MRIKPLHAGFRPVNTAPLGKRARLGDTPCTPAGEVPCSPFSDSLGKRARLGERPCTPFSYPSRFLLQGQVYQRANAEATKQQLRPGYKEFILVTVSQPILSSNLTRSLLSICEESSTLGYGLVNPLAALS